MKIIERTIPDIIDNEYREYCKYVLEQRAIPNAIDGLKPVQRKILYQLIHKFTTGRNKLSEIGGSLSSINYHHGEAAATAAAVKMGQDWDNNLTLLQNAGDCDFGSRFVHDAAAARYIFGRLSENYKNYFKDTELALPRPDPEDPEPQFYLPVIPWILVNGIKGIAVGFACEFQPYNPKDLAVACAAYLEGKELPKLKPWFRNFKGSIKRNDRGSWSAYGKYELRSQTEIAVTELTPSDSCEGYINFLNRMVEQDRIIDWADNCEGDDFEFVLKVTRKQRDWFLEHEYPHKRLSLEEALNENLTTIDAEGNLRVFENVQEIIKYFCDVRKDFYVKRKHREVKKCEDNLRWLHVKREFVVRVANGSLAVGGMKKSEYIEKVQKIHSLKPTFDEASRLVQMHLYSICADEIDELDREIKQAEALLVSWKKTVPVDLFKEELLHLTR